MAARPEAIIRRYYSRACSGIPETIDVEASNSAVTAASTSTLIATKNSEPDVNILPVDLAHRLEASEPFIVSFRPLQEWEGYVVAIEADSFVARLVDITAGEQVEGEEVSLPLNDLTSQERSDIRVGSVLRWAIGYQITRGGQRKRASQIVFRQLPRWSKRDLDQAELQGRKRADSIRWE